MANDVHSLATQSSHLELRQDMSHSASEKHFSHHRFTVLADNHQIWVRHFFLLQDDAVRIVMFVDRMEWRRREALPKSSISLSIRF